MQNSLRRPSAVGEHVGAIRVTDDLHVAFPVAQIDENDTAMVTTAVDPSAKGHGLADQGFGHQTAIVGTHGHKNLSLTAPQIACGPRVQKNQGGGGRLAFTCMAAGPPGTTTPMEITYFKASSTLIFSSITSARGIIRKKPDVGFGVVGT